MKNGIHGIIIIGGGLSGSYLAFKLKEKFQDLLIVEKSKVLGGRLCTKPVGSGMADYGCQYISPKSKELISLVSLLEKKSLLKKIKISPKKHVYISPYGMNKIPQYLSLGVPSIINSYVNKITRKTGIWEVKVGSFSYFAERIVLTMPIKQVSSLIEKSLVEKYTLPKSNYKQFYTATFLANRAHSKNIFDNSESLSWICNNKLKGLFNEKNVYTVNFSSELSIDYKELDYESRVKAMGKILNFNGFDSIENLDIHYWKHAFSSKQDHISHFFDEDTQIGICGDSFSIGQADGAIISSDKVYQKLLSSNSLED